MSQPSTQINSIFWYLEPTVICYYFPPCLFTPSAIYLLTFGGKRQQKKHIQNFTSPLGIFYVTRHSFFKENKVLLFFKVLPLWSVIFLLNFLMNETILSEKLQKDLNNNSPIMGYNLHSKSKEINCSKDSRALVSAKCSFIIY